MRSLEGDRDLQRTERPPSEARDCKEEVSRQRGGLVSKPNHPEMADADRGEGYGSLRRGRSLGWYRRRTARQEWMTVIKTRRMEGISVECCVKTIDVEVVTARPCRSRRLARESPRFRTGEFLP